MVKLFEAVGAIAWRLLFLLPTLTGFTNRGERGVDDPRTEKILKQIALDFENETGIKLSIKSKDIIKNDFKNQAPPELIDLIWK